jgi:hypothetical protein
LEPHKLHRSVLQRLQAKMPAHSQHLSTAECTVIAIAAAGGGTAVVTAAASATGAEVQGDGSPWKADTCDFSVSATPRLLFAASDQRKRRSQAHGTVALNISIAQSSEHGLPNNTANQ